METNPTITHTVTFELPKVANNQKLRAIGEASARNLLSLIADQETDILRALQEADEGKASLSHSIKLDFGKSKQTDSLSFSIKHGDEIQQAIPDPEQPDLWEATPRKTDGAPALALSAPVEIIDAEIVDADPGQQETEEPMPPADEETPQPAADY